MADEWIMYGMEWDDPYRIRSWKELISWVNEVGFLPLFRNEIGGFSVEEHTSNLFWWTGDEKQDPWTWRELIARTGEVAYGKFFGGKAGFVSKAWFPVLANYRRDGSDFDTRWEEGIANLRSKKIMDCLEVLPEMSAVALKQSAGFGKGGEKNFPGIVTELQMQTYLVVSDFRRKVSKAGLEYGMPVSIYTTPEQLWGYDAVTAAYSEDPQDSYARICEQVRKNFPWAQDELIRRMMK